MTKPSLLADLVLRLAQSPEDVATEALTLILGRSDPARQALNGLLAHWSQVADRSITRWRAQVAGADDCRTDMEGEDASGVMRVILENKFWAGLTPNQPSTYLRRLPADGLLAFVVPTARLTVIVIELLGRAAASGFGTLEFRPAGDSRVAKVSAAQTLVVTSWDVILNTVGSALEAAQDHTALADLRQLQGLTERMDTEGFLPLTATDITAATPRRVMQLCGIVDEVYALAARLPYVPRQGLRLSSGAGWYGPYLTVHGFGCQLVFIAKRWAKFGISPLWFQVASKGKTRDALHVPLAETLPDQSWLRAEADGDTLRFWFPIRLPEGRERDVVVKAVLTQIERVAAVLALHSPTEMPNVPPAAGPAS